MIHTHPISPLDTSWLGNHSPNYPPLITLTSKWVDCPGGKCSNNNSRTSGKGGLPTTFMSCNITNAGTDPPMYNRDIPWSWGKTTRLHFTGLQRSSMMSTQELTAKHEWSQSRPVRGHSKGQLQKFAPYRMLKMSCSFSKPLGGARMFVQGTNFWILPFLLNLCYYFDCFNFDLSDYLSLFVFFLMLILRFNYVICIEY